MKEDPGDLAAAAELRRRAEALLKQMQPKGGAKRTAADTERLVHEMEVHEIELEMQKEELVLARAELETLVTQFSDLYDFSPVGYFTFDSDGLIQRVNLTGARLLDTERSRLVNRRFGLFVANADRKAFSEFLGRVFSGDAKESCELTLLLERDRLVVVEVEGIRSTDGLQCRAVVLDITERTLAERQAHRQSALLDAANDAIYVFSPEETVTYWNAAAELLFGRTRAGALGHRISELTGFEPAGFNAAVETLMGKGAWSGELKTTSLGGRDFVVFCRFTLLGGDLGRPLEILAISSDVTEMKLLETRLLGIQRLESIGTLAAGIAHDLNNLLTPILMSTELLREMIPDREDRTLIDTVETCAIRGADIIRQLLTFASGKPGESVPFPVRHLLVELNGIIRETFPRNIDVRFNEPDDLWQILGDATQVYQVLMNLCVNARDAMPDGGSLALSAENVNMDTETSARMPGTKPGPFVHLAVTDTGTGIPPDILDRIFDPFFTTKDVGKGTGLGLSAAMGIMRGHEGFIEVESQAGRGSVFHLYFRAAPGAKVRVPAQAVDLPARGHGETILLVDDEATIRDVVQHILERHGYNVIVASEGREALTLFSRHKSSINAVITDMMMPGMDGPALVESLRHKNAGLPIIGITGLASNPDVERLERLNWIISLDKPFSGVKLLSVLADTLSKARQGSN